MIRYRLEVQTIYGAPLAVFDGFGELGEAVVMVPGLEAPEWAELAGRLMDFGMARDTHVSLGPLLRFSVKRWDDGKPES